MRSAQDKVKVGISQGDINGIGYEVIIKTLMDKRVFDFVTPIVYGSPKLLAYHRKAADVENFNLTNISSADKASNSGGSIINCTDDSTRIELGLLTQESGKAAYDSLERVTEDMRNGMIDVLVTAPINKKSINLSGFEFPGHTEYLQDKFEADNVLMIMVGERLKVGTVTGHLPLKDVASKITKQLILKKLRILNESLQRDFGIQKAKIAVLGINPHAGDEGLLGSEEKEYIIPAIERARDEGIMALGPFPADGFFGSPDFMNFDAVLAMYHDQGLIPFKAIEYQSGVNFTAGLPVVRTSPSHGTAFNIAGQGEASPDSFRAAVFLGQKIFRNRKDFDKLTKNSLNKKK
ncbi:MAG: 4-hydroxythreonine-4-phosphate dehydrogenase PdxA [Bacteroidota bacterium]|nr:4-hydroxythreonine-4-phosphate dehydrogenase PdxA [Bacteroidota bacterium]